MKQDNLTSVFMRISGRLRASARRIIGDVDVDDVLQESFVKLWNKRDELADDEKIEGTAVVTVRKLRSTLCGVRLFAVTTILIPILRHRPSPTTAMSGATRLKPSAKFRASSKAHSAPATGRFSISGSATDGNLRI